MNPKNKAVFEECRQYYMQILLGQELSGISYQQRLNLEQAIADEFQPGFTSNRDCPACVKEMITLAYYYYDKL